MDIWTKDKRSIVMSKIRSKNTTLEIKFRKMLFAKGFRYKINVASLPGKPDVVLPRYNTVIFIHGCFWHFHAHCRDGTIPKTRTNYWKKKLLGNKERDNKHKRKLNKLGWRVLTVWECEIENKPEATLKNAIAKITYNYK